MSYLLHPISVIIKKKSGSYSPGSKCSEFMEYIARRRFDSAYQRCLELLFDCPNADENYPRYYYDDYLDHLRLDFEADFHSMPYKMKNANSYRTLDELIQKAQCNGTRELKTIMCCLDRDMPGKHEKWLDLMRAVDARTLECFCYSKLITVQDAFHVSRDRDSNSVDRTALDLMDTTITVIIEDLI